MKLYRATPLLLAALALAACGSSGTHVVNVPVTATDSMSTSSTATTVSTSTASARSVTGTVGTATAPAFASSTASAGGSTAAVAVVQARGCTAVDPAQYHSGQTLRVLVGRCSGGEQAFFFVDGRYIGTDAKAPSSHVSVVSQNDTAVTLAYALSHPDGSPAGTQNVQFALDNGMLSPMGSIPSASPSAAVSRR